MVDWLNDNSGAVQAIAVVVLVLVTAVYAVLTWRIARAAHRQADASAEMARATQEQANASVEMAREMREARLDSDRPYLLIETLDLDTIEWHEVVSGDEPEADPYSAYPKHLSCRVHNAGRGPAKQVRVTLLQPLVAYDQPTKDLLRPGDSWEVRLAASEAAAWLHEGFTGEAPLGIEAWMRRSKVKSRMYGGGYDCGLVVGCTDIHDRPWATYLKFGLRAVTDNVRKVVTSRTVQAVEHRIVALEGSDEPTPTGRGEALPSEGASEGTP